MAEVTHAGKDHRDVVLVSSSDDFFVTHRTTRLDNSSGTGLNRGQKTIRKREERIRRYDRTLGAQFVLASILASFFCFPGCNARAVNAAHLACTNANGLAVFDIDNGV